MDARQLAAITALALVSYTPGCWDKRFARAMAEQATEPTFEPTTKQWAQIQRVAHRYRRQVPAAAHRTLCATCGPEMTVPLFAPPLFASAEC